MKDIKDKTKEVIEHIKYVYENIDLPWVVGYSGGKDSTCMLQLIWHALSEVDKSKRNRQVFIIFSDTMVETPVISNYMKKTTNDIDKETKKEKLPISIHCLLPDIQNTFWVNLLGRGYPAPRTRFRWCTDRLKIEPANKFILNVVSKYGEAIVVLGARKEESASRAQVLAKWQSKENFTAGAILPRHSTLSNACVYTPIANWTTRDVWEYLLLNSATPWGSNNRDLAAMYKDSTAGECPLVVDKSTPSCGNSRFGCWVCTVVERNRSLENMVDKGQEWLEPLLNYWNVLMDTTDPEKKAKYRSYKRRIGQVKIQARSTENEIKIIRGPYKFEYRKKFLYELLKAQQEINKDIKEKIELITEEELKIIRKIWITEENDWEDSVPMIYRKVMHKDGNWDTDDAASFGTEELNLLEKVCSEYGVPSRLVARLIDKEREFNALGKRSTLNKELDSILKEEWRSEKEFISAYKKKR